MHVYVQQSSRITLPLNPLIEMGSELYHLSIPTNSGEGDAGMTINSQYGDMIIVFITMESYST
jgi:hypothetical protein